MAETPNIGKFFKTFSGFYDIPDHIQERIDEANRKEGDKRQAQLQRYLKIYPNALSRNVHASVRASVQETTLKLFQPPVDTITNSFTGKEHRFPGYDFEFSSKLFAVFYGAESEALDAELNYLSQQRRDRNKKAKEAFTLNGFLNRLTKKRQENNQQVINDLRTDTRKFLRRLRSSRQYIPEKRFEPLFDSVFSRPRTNTLLPPNFKNRHDDDVNLDNLGFNAQLFAPAHAAIALQRGENFAPADLIRTPPSETPDFVLVSLAARAPIAATGTISGRGTLTVDSTPLDHSDEGKPRTLVLDYSDFNRLRYNAPAPDGDNDNPLLDYFTFTFVKDTNSDGRVDNGDETVSRQITGVAVNKQSTVNATDTQRRFVLQAEKDSRFSSIELRLNGVADALQAYRDGTLSFSGHEVGNASTTVEVDEDESNANRLVLRLKNGKSATDGIELNFASSSGSLVPSGTVALFRR